MADKLAELMVAVRGLSIDELRLVLRFAEWLAKQKRGCKGVRCHFT
ncbi:hypothetical protein ES705_26655 [subsurface metagenome]